MKRQRQKLYMDIGGMEEDVKSRDEERGFPGG